MDKPIIMYGFQIDLTKIGSKVDRTIDDLKIQYPKLSKDRLEIQLLKYKQDKQYDIVRKELDTNPDFENNIKLFKKGSLFIGWDIKEDIQRRGVSIKNLDSYYFKPIINFPLFQGKFISKEPKIYLFE